MGIKNQTVTVVATGLTEKEAMEAEKKLIKETRFVAPGAKGAIKNVASADIGKTLKRLHNK